MSSGLRSWSATSPDISVDEREEFSRYATWDWAPRTDRAVDTSGSDGGGLDRELALLVERELERRGFERVHRRPDLRVGARLEVRREEVIRYETAALEQLSSLHSSPSFQVQKTVKRRQTYERSRLVIVATDARRCRIVWEGALEERFLGRFSPHLKRTVASLLERFPPAGRASTGGPPHDRDPGTGLPSVFTGTPSPSTAEPSS
jgi:hypothetical protein